MLSFIRIFRDSNETTTHSHHDMTKDDNESEHFSTFALSGNNGTIRWHHLPGDFAQTTQETMVIYLNSVV